MNKKKITLVLGLAVIVVVTVALLFLPLGKKEEKELPEENETSTEQEPEKETTEQTVATEQMTTERMTAEVPPATTEQATEARVDGSGPHKGKLGSSFTIPDGFYNISPKGETEGNIYIFEDPERNMILQVEEYYLPDRPIGFDGQYTVFHNMYQSDPGTYVINDEKNDDHYIITGYTDDRSRVFYIESSKYSGRNEVRLTAEYPNDETKEENDALLEAFLKSYSYTYVSAVEQRKQEQEEQERWEEQEELFNDPTADPNTGQ